MRNDTESPKQNTQLSTKNLIILVAITFITATDVLMLLQVELER